MKTPEDLDLLMLYRDQEIIVHPRFGSYYLSGVYSHGVFARRNPTADPEDEEVEMFDFSEIDILLKPSSWYDEYMTRHNVKFLREKAQKGYWIGDTPLYD